jgi:phage-related minor tail protein
MASNNIARLGVVLGIDTASFTADIDKAISENKKLKAAIERDSKAAAGAIADLIHATEDYGKTLTKVEQIQREISSGKFMNATASAKQQLLEQAAAYDKIATAQKKVTTGMTEQQKLSLTYQTTDLFTQIASGGNPMIALIQQGGQLKDAMGGLGNMFRMLGTFITPVNVAIVVGTAAFGAYALAMYKAQQEMDNFNKSMILTGKYAGIAYDELVNLGKGLSQSVGTSIGEARDAMAAIQSSGQFTQRTLESVGTVVLKFAQLSGMSAKEAADKLIPSLDGTASSAKKLNEQYHFLTFEQYKNIEALEKQGKLQDAAKMTADALSESFSKTKRELGTLETAWKNVSEFASKAWDAMLGFGREKGLDRAKVLEDKINQLTTEIEERTAKGLKSGSQQAAVSAFKAELQAIVDRVGQEMDKAEAASKKAEAEQKKIADYSKAGGAGKGQQLTYDIAKLEAEIKYAVAVENASEIRKVELEAEKKKLEKIAEYNKASDEEKRAFGGMLKTKLAKEEILIEQEKIDKIKAINYKYYWQEYEANVRAMQTEEEFQKQKNQKNIDAQQALYTQLHTEEAAQILASDKLKLQMSMIGATEKELNLAIHKLEVEKEIAEWKKSEQFGTLSASDQQYYENEKRRVAGLKEVVIEQTYAMKKMEEVSSSVWSNISEAIDNFVKNGKLSFKDLAKSIIQDLIAIQLKAQTVSLLNSAFKMFGFDFALPARAAGGPVSAGSPYMVGEKGPELFMPSGSGTIIPNNAVGSMGGTTNVTNNYINAIDTKSFEDRLLGSSMAVWAANQYAGKSMPTNFGRT